MTDWFKTKQMDYVAALGLVFFTSLPLVAAVHFLRLALKRETIGH